MGNREKAEASDWKIRRRIPLEEKHENFIAAVRKWEILAASKVKNERQWKQSEQEHKQQIFGDHIRQFLDKMMCNKEVSRFSRAKQPQRNVQKSVLHMQICIFC